MILNIGLNIEAFKIAYGNTKEHISYWDNQSKLVHIKLEFDEVVLLFKEKINNKEIILFIFEDDLKKLITNITNFGIYSTTEF